MTFLRAIATAPLESVTEVDHRQEFRRQADRQRNCKQQRLKRIAVAHDAHDNQKQHEEENRSREELAEFSHATIESGLFRPGRETGRDVAEGCSSAGRTTSAVAVPLTTEVP